MMQQLHRRLHPSRPVPQTEADLAGLLVLLCLERQGGHRSHRELGLVAWVLGHAIDAAASGDHRRTKEILALLMVAVEQAVTDRGDWTLLGESPLQMFEKRCNSTPLQAVRAFGATAMDGSLPVIPEGPGSVVNQKTETAKKAAKAAPTPAAPNASSEPDQEASPKRKPRFPRKPKSKATPDA